MVKEISPSSYIVQVLKNTDKKSTDGTDAYDIYCKYYEKQKKQAEEILKINDANELNENLNEKLAFQIEDFIKEFGLKVEKTFSLEVSGKIKNKEITINSNDIPERQNFTMAHELGHYFLHLKDGDTERVDYRGLSLYSSPKDREEIEANKFASEILMPEYIVKKIFNKLQNCSKEESGYTRELDDRYINSLAYYFKVSKLAMTIKLKTLELITLKPLI